MGPPIPLSTRQTVPVTTKVVWRSSVPVSTTTSTLPVTTQTLPVVVPQQIQSRPVYNTISTGSIPVQPRPAYSTVSTRPAIPVPPAPVYSTVSTRSAIPVQPAPVYTTVSATSRIAVPPRPVYTTLSARLIAPVQSVIRPPTLTIIPINPVVSTPVLTQTIPTAPLTSIAAPVQSVVPDQLSL